MECQKHGWTSKRATREARGNLRSGDRVRIYWCDQCRLYHLTSSVGRAKNGVFGWRRKAVRDDRRTDG